MRLVVVLMLLAGVASAEDECPTIKVSMVPTEKLQIVVKMSPP